MANPYVVYTRFEGNDKTKIKAYVLIQADSFEDAQKTPFAVEFPISAAYDKHTQETRAIKFKNYLNKIVEMTNDLEKCQDI